MRLYVGEGCVKGRLVPLAAETERPATSRQAQGHRDRAWGRWRCSALRCVCAAAYPYPESGT